MAEKLKKFPGGPGKARYPWHEWLDGSPWLLRRGEDYATNTPSFLATANKAARVKGIKLRSHTVKDKDGEGIVIQAYEG